MATLNYTTKIDPGQSIAEMTSMLVRAGAAAISTSYELGRPVALSFTLPTDFGVRSFSLPCNVAGMSAALKRQETAGEFAALRKARGTFTSADHAARVAWRVLKDWLAAQLALIDANQATAEQVMLPYLLVDPGSDRTLYEAYRASELKAIAAGGPQ